MENIFLNQNLMVRICPIPHEWLIINFSGHCQPSTTNRQSCKYCSLVSQAQIADPNRCCNLVCFWVPHEICELEAERIKQ